MLVAQHGAIDGERLFVVGSGGGQVTLGTQELAEVVEAGGGVRMLGSK